jgi:hypothetical protein
MLLELFCPHGHIQWALPLFPFGQLDSFPEIDVALIKLNRFSSCRAFGVLSSLRALVLFKLLDEFIKVSRWWAPVSSFNDDLKILLLHQISVAWLSHV